MASKPKMKSVIDPGFLIDEHGQDITELNLRSKFENYSTKINSSTPKKGKSVACSYLHDENSDRASITTRNKTAASIQGFETILEQPETHLNH